MSESLYSKIIQNKKYFTSNKYGFYSVFHPNSTAKRVQKFPETVKFQPKCTEFRLRLGLCPRPRCGAHIAPMPSPLSEEEERGAQSL